MNASSSKDKKRVETVGNDLLLPPKQTEWRRYSKTLIEELKEKLEDRRAKTLALLSENKDLSAFQEIDTESDGLDDTSTNATSKHEDDRLRSGILELSSEQVMVVSSQSEASSITDPDCCGAPCGYCASSADAAVGDGVCTHSSYSMTSSTGDEGESKSLSPPRPNSVVTMTPVAGRWKPGEENLPSFPYLDNSDEDIGCMRVNKSSYSHGRVTTAYMVRRSSSHCCLNTTCPMYMQNVNVRLSRSYTYLCQDVDYELPCETTSSKFSYFKEVVRLVPAASSCVPIKSHIFNSLEVLRNATSNEELAGIEQVGSIKDTELSQTKKDGIGKPIISDRDVVHFRGESLLEESCAITDTDHDTSTYCENSTGMKRIAGMPHCDLYGKFGDSLSLDEEKGMTTATELLNRIDDRINVEQNNKQCGDPEVQIKTIEQMDSRTESLNSAYIDRVTSELDYLQRKMMLEEICNVIKSSISGDVDRRLVLELKQKIDQCSVSLNVSGNSGYMTVQQDDSGGTRIKKEEPCIISGTDSCSSQLKKCLEKAHLASLLQKEMGRAKSNVASIAAKRAYEKAIGDFDSIVNDYLKSGTHQDSNHDEQNKVDLVAAFRRSETFIIDKGISLPHSIMSKQPLSSFVNSDTRAQKSAKPGRYTDNAGNITEDMQGASCGKDDNDMPPKSSPTFFVSQNISEDVGKQKKKKPESRRKKIRQFLTENKMQDTNAFVMKHFGSGTRTDSESDSSDSLSDVEETNPFTYTSSMLAQLLDYDSQDEKVTGKAEYLDLALKRSDQSSDNKGREEHKPIAEAGQILSKGALDFNADDEKTHTVSFNVENDDEKLEEADKLEPEANYDSDFNAGSISECIQEEERSCDEDNDPGLCFYISDKKDVDSATFNVDRLMDSKDCSEIELNMNEETPAVKEVSTLASEVYQYSEDIDVRDETNDVIEGINVVDVARCHEISLCKDNDEVIKSEIIKDISETDIISDSNIASDKLDLINQKVEIKDADSTQVSVAKGSDKDGHTENITREVVAPDVCQSATTCSNKNEVVIACAGSSGASSSSKLKKPRFDQTRKLKKTGEKLEESCRSPFIPMVEWSSSEEDIFEDLTRDKSPSDILRQKQKEVVDEKLKQLTQMSKRRKKSRSPVSYKTPPTLVNLETLLDGNAREENRDNRVGPIDTTNTSLRFAQQHLYTVLRSPIETQREPDCVQLSVSDLLLARLSGEDFSPTQEEKTKDQIEQTVLQISEENFLNSYQSSKPSTLKGLVSPSKVTRTQEPTMRYLGISSFTVQSPTKSTLSSNQKVVIRDISSKTASTDPASSVSSTSGEYNFPEYIDVPQKESRLKTRFDGIPQSCNESPKAVPVSSDGCEEHVVSCGPSSQHRTDAAGRLVRNAKRVECEPLSSDLAPFFSSPGHKAKYVDNVVREVKIEQPATSQCGDVPLLTAVTEGGPSVICAEEEAHEIRRQNQRDGTALKKLKDCLLNDGSFCSPKYPSKTGITNEPAADVRSSYPLRYDHENIPRELHCSEDESYPLYPTPTSRPGSPYDNVIVDDVGAGVASWDMEECRGHAKEGTTGDWMFVGDVNDFKQCVETTRYLNIDNECVFKVLNTGYDQTNKRSENCNAQTRVIESQAQTNQSEKMTGNSAIASCRRDTKEFTNQLCSSNMTESLNTNQETVLEYHSGRSDILVSILQKITLLESLVGQSQKSEASRNPQAHNMMDPVSFFLSGQQEIMAGQSSHPRLSVNAPVFCPCRLHDCTRNSFPGCCDHCGVCGRMSAHRCQAIAHPETSGHGARGPNIASKASQTDDPDGESKAASKTQNVSTQWQKLEEIFDVVKQTRQIGCQAELSRERCQCMQQCISSLEHLEGIERKLHGEVVDLIKSLKRDTEEMVSVGYDRVVSLLVTHLNEASSRSQQSVSSLITTFNQSLTQQLSDVTRCIGNLQCNKDTSANNKGQTTKPGMDYDTLKMRVVELTSQRDAEKVFHKITRESLRALERDHDRLRQEYVRATCRRLNHNNESEVRHRVYNLLNEPGDTYRCRHKHDKGHHSKYVRGATEDWIAKSCPCEEEPRSTRNSSRPLQLSETCKELPKNRHDSLTELLANSEKTRSKSHRKEKRGVHLSKQRVALLDKDVLDSFNKDTMTENNENCGQEIVQENSHCCMVDLKPTSRPTAEDITILQKSSGHSRTYLENLNKTDGPKKYESDIKEEHSNTSERRHSVKDTTDLVKLPSSKDEDVSGKGHLLPQPFEGYGWSKTKADPPLTDSKCSLALSNESF